MPPSVFSFHRTFGGKLILPQNGVPAVTTGDTWRVQFSGVTVKTGCFAGCLANASFNIASGAVDGTYDLVFQTLGVCRFMLTPLLATFSGTLYTASSTCTGANVPLGSGSNPIIRFGDATSDGVIVAFQDAAAGLIFFDSLIPWCDFEDGMTVNNEITAPTPVCHRSRASENNNFTVAGYGGTVTITRVC